MSAQNFSQNILRFLIICIGIQSGPSMYVNKKWNWNRLGESFNYHWVVNKTNVDWRVELPEPIIVSIPTETQTVTLDIHRTGLVIVDMQNDFVSKGGWLDANGANVEKMSSTIEPIRELTEKMRNVGFKVFWLNWVNRKDYANMFPNMLWLADKTGDSGAGFGAVTSDQGESKGSKALERGSWGVKNPDGLLDQVKPGDTVVEKTSDSGFWGNDFNAILRNYDMKNLIFVGSGTDQCLFFTMADAHFNGFGCIMVRDCTASPAPDWVVDGAIWQVKHTMGFVTNSSNILEAISKQKPAKFNMRKNFN